MVKLNFNLAAFSFQRGVAILAKSFASAIVALNADVQNAKDEAFGYQQALEQGGEWIGETDEDGTVIWDQSQILDYEVDVVDEAAQELRKAFALALYHHWERSARLWTQADNWSHEQLVEFDLERRVATRRLVRRLQLQEARHQRLRHELSTVGSEAPAAHVRTSVRKRSSASALLMPGALSTPRHTSTANAPVRARMSRTLDASMPPA